MAYLDTNEYTWDHQGYFSSYPISPSTSSTSSRRTTIGSPSSQGSNFEQLMTMSPVYSNDQGYYNQPSNEVYVQPHQIYPGYDYSEVTYDTSYSGQISHNAYAGSQLGTPPPAPVKTKSDDRYTCTYPGCKSTGKFKRVTDYQRHMKTVHYPERFDCKYAKGGFCGREGTHGFTRQDHYNDHLRDVHRIDIPKASGKGSGSKSSRN
ncbi:MAG: hypothetical protein MMC23_006280 [Stictis urceolatum]|nr:hypothetical protein [Stictis urceolata]